MRTSLLAIDGLTQTKRQMGHFCIDCTEIKTHDGTSHVPALYQCCLVAPQLKADDTSSDSVLKLTSTEQAKSYTSWVSASILHIERDLTPCNADRLIE